MRHLLTLFSLCLCVAVNAQPGNYRNELSVGVGGGWVMSNVGFSPRVPQSMHQGFMGGVAVKYLTEKYFSTYCSIVAELNYARLGWKENIRTETKEAVINPVSNLPEEYSRHIDYLQLPVFAHLAWGKAENGFQFFSEPVRNWDSTSRKTPQQISRLKTETSKPAQTTSLRKTVCRWRTNWIMVSQPESVWNMPETTSDISFSKHAITMVWATFTVIPRRTFSDVPTSATSSSS